MYSYSFAHISVTTVCCSCAQVDTTEQLPVQKVVSNHNAIQTFLTNSRQGNCPLVDSDFHQQFSDKKKKQDPFFFKDMFEVYELICSQTVYWTSDGLIYCLAQLNSRVPLAVTTSGKPLPPTPLRHLPLDPSRPPPPQIFLRMAGPSAACAVAPLNLSQLKQITAKTSIGLL